MQVVAPIVFLYHVKLLAALPTGVHTVLVVLKHATVIGVTKIRFIHAFAITISIIVEFVCVMELAVSMPSLTVTSPKIEGTGFY